MNFRDRLYRLLRCHLLKGVLPRRYGSRRPVLAAVALLGLTACQQSVDLTAVRQLASAASSAQAGLNAVATDFYDSCVRRTIYDTIAAGMSADFPGSLAPAPGDVYITTDPAAGLAAKLSAAAGDATFASTLTVNQYKLLVRRADLGDVFKGLSAKAQGDLAKSPGAMAQAPSAVYLCTAERTTSQGWVAANNVLIAYFVALGKLAGKAPDETADTYGGKKLGTALKSFGLVGGDVVGNLVNTTLAAIYDAKRKGTLSQEIPKAEDDVQAAVKVLSSIATDNYGWELTQEASEASHFLYQNLLLAKPGADAFQVLSYADSWSQRVQAIVDHRTALASYTSGLAKLAKQHSSLLEAIQDDSLGKALGVAQVYYSDLKPDIDAMLKPSTEGKK